MDGLVFHIQRFSIGDGPGIRTTVFLQGCNLCCFWCHNPESRPYSPQVQFFPDRCIVCGKCVEVCPEKAQLLVDGKRMFLRHLCKKCGTCVEYCFARALVIKAKTMTVEQVITEVERDRSFYVESNGGVTFSGGDPVVQKDFLTELLRESKARGLHTVVDTAANCPWQTLQQLLPFADLFLVDIKAFDDNLHKRGTGANNRHILRNVAKLASGQAEVWVRVPVIPGYNDNAGELGSIAAFLADLTSVRRVDLLPFHHLGAGKYESLGMEYTAKELRPPPEESMARLVEVFTAKGLNATLMAPLSAVCTMIGDSGVPRD